MVSNMHRLLLREGRNNRSNSDFQTFFEEFSLYIVIHFFLVFFVFLLKHLKSRPHIIMSDRVTIILHIFRVGIYTASLLSHG